jgi:hypothetical protein
LDDENALKSVPACAFLGFKAHAIGRTARAHHRLSSMFDLVELIHHALTPIVHECTNYFLDNLNFTSSPPLSFPWSVETYYDL